MGEYQIGLRMPGEASRRYHDHGWCQGETERGWRCLGEAGRRRNGDAEQGRKYGRRQWVKGGGHGEALESGGERTPRTQSVEF